MKQKNHNICKSTFNKTVSGRVLKIFEPRFVIFMLLTVSSLFHSPIALIITASNSENTYLLI